MESAHIGIERIVAALFHPPLVAILAAVLVSAAGVPFKLTLLAWLGYCAGETGAVMPALALAALVLLMPTNAPATEAEKRP